MIFDEGLTSQRSGPYMAPARSQPVLLTGPQRQEKTDRNLEVVELVMVYGLTYEAAGRKYDITRARVGQLVEKYGGQFKRSPLRRQEWDLLRFIAEYQHINNGDGPTIQEMTGAGIYKSQVTVIRALKVLEVNGKITRTGKRRGVRVVGTPGEVLASVPRVD